MCIGCGGCTTLAPSMSMRLDGSGHLKPEHARINGEDFARICPFSPEAANEDEIAADLFPDARRQDPATGRYEAAYVGHVSEPNFRAEGSSGGMVTWVAAELLRRGIVDGIAHVAPRHRSKKDDRLFAYRISRSEQALREGAKSRYYPVELSSVLREIEAVPGRYAIVGIPCFIKAVNLLRRTNPLMSERITATLGLFCGHMKSAQMVDSFAWQLGYPPGAVAAADFRLKNPDRPANWYTAQLTFADGTSRQQDWWHLVEGDWGSGFFMNPACNFCDDVMAETGDIAFGDAWAEPYASDGRGANVVVVRSPAMGQIIRDGMREGRLALEAVDSNFVSATQAAGLRQRREGLAYRLARSKLGVPPRKRVAPSLNIARRRRLIYRMRQAISIWSPRVYRLARALRWRGLYLAWGRMALAAYHGLAYSRGRLGRTIDRLMNAEAAHD